MMTKNKFLSFGVMALLLITSVSNAFAATNKETLLSNITTLDQSITTLKTSKITDLESRLTALSKDYDTAMTSLGYDAKTLNYLVSLGKMNTNMRNDLVAEFIALKNEITSKTTLEATSLSSIKDKIQYQYTTVSDAEKSKLEADIKKIEDNYKNLSTTLTASLNTLDTKYKTNLASYKSTLSSLVNTNSTTLTTLKNFNTQYENLFSAKTDFDKNYVNFKESYLSFAGELNLFSQEKQKVYVAALAKELKNIIDKNIAANPSLEKHILDINRLNDILVENFTNSLSTQITDSYGVIYSDVDISSIDTRFNAVKNRYFDSNGNLVANEVLSNSGALAEVQFLNTKFTEVNTKVKTLLGNDNSQNTLSNLKIRLENEMIKFYNANYAKYSDDLLLKLKEKLDITALENRNILLAADSIDIRYGLFSDKITKSKDPKYIDAQIAIFKKEMEKYSYLQSQAIDNKIKRILNNSYKYSIDIELANIKYKRYLSRNASYEKQLKTIFPQMEKKFATTYISRLEKLVAQLDVLLTKKLSDKNRHQVLVIKKIVIEYLNTQYK